MSRHLRHLRESKVVDRRREGQRVIDRSADPVIARLCRLICESLLKSFNEETGGAAKC